MNKSALFLLLLTSVFFTSCIPTKQLIYLQDDGTGAAPVVNQVMTKPYRLQTNDIISVTIKASDPELVKLFTPSNSDNITSNRTESSLYFEGYTVNDHGNIRMPILDEVAVLGLTIDEVRQLIEKRLFEEYFTEQENLFVSIKLAGFRYTINGEVGNPGTKILFQEKLNIMEAIANAGDITLTGDRTQVTIIRQLPHGSEMHTIDLTSKSAMQSPYYNLQPNDYVYVKPLPQKTLGTGTTAAQSLTTVISVLSLLTTVTLLLTR